MVGPVCNPKDCFLLESASRANDKDSRLNVEEICTQDVVETASRVCRVRIEYIAQYALIARVAAASRVEMFLQRNSPSWLRSGIYAYPNRAI